MGINTVVHTDGDSSADIDTGVHTNRQGKQCGNRHRYTQVHTDRQSSMGLNTGAHIDRQAEQCGYRHRYAHNLRGTPVWL